MGFIEILKSVGGVIPCGRAVHVHELEDGVKHGCELCKETGQILNLAPLLAKPSVLTDCVLILLNKRWDYKYEIDNLYVVGPQRAHSLVYEVSRQLGGTAVMCASELKIVLMKDKRGDNITGQKCVYRLSLLIPPDATILFVTDRLDEKEMNAVIAAVAPKNPLPYILSLVARDDTFRHSCEVDAACSSGLPNSWKVISLHKE